MVYAFTYHQRNGRQTTAHNKIRISMAGSQSVSMAPIHMAAKSFFSGSKNSSDSFLSVTFESFTLFHHRFRHYQMPAKTHLS